MRRLTALLAALTTAGCTGMLPQRQPEEATDGQARTPPARITPEHEFLTQFEGEWTTEADSYLAPGQPSVKSKGTMSCTMIGSYWAVLTVKGELSRRFEGQGTFGYDANKQRYVGSWIDSKVNHFWWYEGSVEGSRLILDTEGPHPKDPKKSVRYRNTWEFKGPDLLVLTVEMLGPEDGMIPVMTATCKRTRMPG